MTELKVKCYSCNFERNIGEREFIEDIQQCPNCGSDNIEIVPTEDSTQVRQIGSYSPEEGERIVKRRMVVIGVIGGIFLVSAIILYSLQGLYLLADVAFPLAITLGVIGVILLVIAIGWATEGQCCCSGC